MNFDKIDLEASSETWRSSPENSTSRLVPTELAMVVPTLLLAAILLLAQHLWALFLRVYGLEVCRSAMQTIRDRQGTAGGVGEPIRDRLLAVAGGRANARIEESETDVLWNIEGPKGGARAH